MSKINLVEMICGGGDSAFDQPCKFGHRVENHAVYCHNDKWADAPRKCRRTWYTGGEVRDEDCEGYEPNPDIDDEFAIESGVTLEEAMQFADEGSPDYVAAYWHKQRQERLGAKLNGAEVAK